MSKKKKTKRKKNSRKGKMPAGLKAYWAKKRRAKNPKKRKRARRRKLNPTRRRTARRRKPVSMRVKNFRRAPRKTRRRRVRRANPRRGVIRIKAPAGLGPKGLRQFRAMAAKAYGAPARIVSR